MIVDTHIHTYDPHRPQGVPWPDPSDTVIYQTTLPDRIVAKLDEEGVTATVIVEASEWVADNDWVLELVADEPRIWGFVGNLSPNAPSFRQDLQRLAKNPLFRGIRVRPRGRALSPDPAAMEGLRLLDSLELSLDLLARPETLPDIASVARQFPTLRIVINHVAHIRIDGAAPDPDWCDGMALLADCPNVYCKVSGLVENAVPRPAPTDPNFYKPILEVLTRTLGPSRLIYASNWPVCERAGDYHTTLDVVRTYFSQLGRDVLEAVLAGNSKSVYRWVQR